MRLTRTVLGHTRPRCVKGYAAALLEQSICVPPTRPTDAMLLRCLLQRFRVSLPLLWSLYEGAAPAPPPAALDPRGQ